MTFDDEFELTRVAIVRITWSKSPMQSSWQRETCDERRMCARLLARWKRERREMNDDGLNETRRRRRQRQPTSRWLQRRLVRSSSVGAARLYVCLFFLHHYYSVMLATLTDESRSCSFVLCLWLVFYSRTCRKTSLSTWCVHTHAQARKRIDEHEDNENDARLFQMLSRSIKQLIRLPNTVHLASARALSNGSFVRQVSFEKLILSKNAFLLEVIRTNDIDVYVHCSRWKNRRSCNNWSGYNNSRTRCATTQTTRLKSSLCKYVWW